MNISFSCDHCGSPFVVDAQLAGRAARCRKCNRKMVIPSASAAAGRPLVEWTNGPGNASRARQPVTSGAAAEGRRAVAPQYRKSPASRGAGAMQSLGWLEAVNSQVGLKPVTMPSMPAVRPKREVKEEKSVTSYKVIVPKEIRRENSLGRRSAKALERQFMAGKYTYRSFFTRFAKLFRWINETAYGISILFLILAIVGVIMNKHSLTILGISAIVLLNVVRLGAGLFNLVVIPFRDNPVKGLLFLFPPVTIYYLWTNWYKWRKPIRRIMSPVLTLVLVIAAYAYVPWLNGNKKAQAKLQDRLGDAVEAIKTDVSGSLQEAGKKASELKEELPGQIEKLHLDEVRDKAQQALDGLKGEIQKSGSSAPDSSPPGDTNESSSQSTP
jgi:hypothetical protein